MHISRLRRCCRHVQYGSHLDHVGSLSARARSTTRTSTKITTRHRPARLDGHRVAFLALIALVMRRSLVVRRITCRRSGVSPDARRTPQCLVHLVADHLAVSSRCPEGSRARRRFGRFTSSHHNFSMRFAQPSRGPKHPARKRAIDALRKHVSHAQFLTHLRKLIRLRAWPAGARHAQIELLAAQLQKLIAEILGLLVAANLRLHVSTLCSNLALDEAVDTDSLAEPSESLASISSLMPSISTAPCPAALSPPVLDVALARAHAHFEALRDRTSGNTGSRCARA